MQKKLTAWSGKIAYNKVKHIPHPIIAVIDFVQLLSETLEFNPELYISKDNVLWIYYPNSCFVCDDFFSEYGIYMAMSKTAVYGGTSEFEGGNLTVEISEDEKSLICEKHNVSGKNFELIRDISLKISLPDQETVNEYRRLLEVYDYKKSFLVISRTAFTEALFDHFKQESKDTYYRYISLNNNEDHYLNSLTVGQRKNLWLVYFENKLSPLEFDDAFSAIQQNEISAFPWELSLRLALEECGITVSYDNGFSISDKSCKHIKPDFRSNCAAEKLFIKLIFPKPYTK